MDEVFGKENFRNEIVWGYTGNSIPKTNFQSKHDILLFYSRNRAKQIFNPLLAPYSESTMKRYNHVDEDGRRYKMSTLGSGLEKVYAKEGKPMEDWWTKIPVVRRKKERTGYPTQKPLALLERIIKASSNPGDMVLDPFCGCATTCVAAEKLDRQWVGIDVSPLAARLVQERIERELGVLLFDPIHRTDIPKDRDGKRSKDIKHILYGMQEGKCNGCLIYFPYVNLTVDHIIPKSKGGANVDENLQLLCARCNSVKGNRTQEYLISQVRMTG